MFKRAITFAALIASTAVPSFAQGRGNQPASQQPPQPTAQSESSSSPREEHFGPAEEKVSTTSHVVRLDGREIRYTATVGTIPIRLDNGEISARMFFVAYTK